MHMEHKKHRNCYHTPVEDAPKILGHGSKSKWAVGATTERRPSWSWGGYLRNGGNKI